MTRIIQGDLCLEKAYKAIFQKFGENKTLQQFKSLEVRAVLLALKNFPKMKIGLTLFSEILGIRQTAYSRL